MNDKLYIKNIKRRNKSKDLLLPFNVINLSNNPSLKDINFKQIVKINNNNNNNTNSFTKKINQGTNTIYSIIKKVKNKNKRNIFNIKKKQFFPEIDDNKYGENFNSSTIRSNGKFQKSNQIHDTNSKKVDKKLFIRQNIKNFLLNKGMNNYDFNIKEKGMQYEEITNYNLENSKKNIKESKYNWKGINISSHYLGNNSNNQFGITSNKFCIDKNFLLTHSKDNSKYKNDYDSNSIMMNSHSASKFKFITLNMPNNSNYFNGMSSTNLFSKMKYRINNEQLYQKLIHQMTTVFKNRINKYSHYKSYENQQKTNFNQEYYFENNIKNIKKQKLFNNPEIIKINKYYLQSDRNDIINPKSNEKYKTFDNSNQFMKVNIRNSNKENFISNLTSSDDDIEMNVLKKKF
jgi:hypothetical protein